MSTPAFHLLDDPWLECEMLDSTVRTLSLQEIASQLGNIRDLRGDWKPQQYALHRVLLAMFWRAHRDDQPLQNQRDASRFDKWWVTTRELFQQDPADAPLRDYLEQHRDRFALFGPTPFMQVANLETSKGIYNEVRRLVPEVESDFFTTAAGEGATRISFAEASRWVVSLQAFDYSGIKSGALGDPRVKGGRGYPIGTGWSGMTGGVLIKGSSLAETLLLNTDPRTVFAPDTADDLPAWEREPDSAAERPLPHPTGPCDLLTWQSRRIRLFTEGDMVTGVLVSNGDQIPGVGANILSDPMTPYRFSSNKSKAGKPVFYPRPHDAERTIWRGLAPLLAREGFVFELKKNELPPKAPKTIEHLGRLNDSGQLDNDLRVGIELISVEYGPQSSSIVDTVYAQLELPPNSFSQQDLRVGNTIIAASKATQEAALALGRFCGELDVAAGGDYAFDAASTGNLLDSLSPAFREWLTTLDSGRTDQALTDWFTHVRRTVRAHADVLLTGAGARALVGREKNERFVSAGTAHQRLLRNLSTILPTPEPQEQAAS